MQDQTKGIDWVNIILGTDFNGDAGSRAAPLYFAEIHLVIPLTAEEKKSLEQLAQNKELKNIKDLLRRALKGNAVNDANKALIEALQLRQ